MTELLIAPDELPAWLPGTLTVRSPEQGWDGVAVRGYQYGASDVEVPPLRDHVVVAYRSGDHADAAQRRRHLDGRTLRPATSRCSPGASRRTGWRATSRWCMST